MQTESRDGSTERRILIACVVSSVFLARVSGKLGKQPFRSMAGNLLYSWSDDYYRRYRLAPGREIVSILETYAATATSKDSVTPIERLLSSLSGEYEKYAEEINVPYTIDLAERHFNEVLLERHEEEIKAWRDKGQIEAALSKIASFRRIDLKTQPAIDLLKDKESQQKALEDKQRVLIKYPGAAGIFFGDEFSEDSFVGVLASVKSGKSYTLLDIAWRALLQHRRVAYFQVGDLSRNQIIRRFHRRAAYRPIDAKTSRYPTGIILPVGQRELAVVDYQERVYEKPILWPLAKRAFKGIASKSRGGLRLSYHPIKTASVSDIRAALERWDQDNWSAQVIVVDYAGNLAPTDPRMSPVDQASNTWALLRQLSEERNCCVVTAHQSNKEGFSTWVLTRKHFSDSKMVMAHVTAFIGVNATEEEKSRGIIRYNFLVRREAEFSESYCLYCASYLDAACPIVCSCLPQRG